MDLQRICNGFAMDLKWICNGIEMDVQWILQEKNSISDMNLIEQNKVKEIKEQLIKKIDSEKFTEVINKMENVVSEMTEDNLLNAINDIKRKHQDILYRKQRKSF